MLALQEDFPLVVSNGGENVSVEIQLWETTGLLKTKNVALFVLGTLLRYVEVLKL